MKGNQNHPNKQVTSNNMTGKNHYRFLIALEATVENTVIIQDIEIQITFHI